MMSIETYSNQLINILAKENLTLTFSNDVEVAGIDMESRLIYVNNFLYTFQDNILAFERILTHEVGHALYTPKDKYKSLAKRYGILVNIFEDIRIENLLKINLPGIRKLFQKGFYELEDILKSENASISKTLSADSPFLDKINVYFKSNCSHPIKFTEVEFEFVRKLHNFVDFEQLNLLLDEFLEKFLLDEHEPLVGQNTTQIVVGVKSTEESLEQRKAEHLENLDNSEQFEYTENKELEATNNVVTDATLSSHIKELCETSQTYKQEQFFSELKTKTANRLYSTGAPPLLETEQTHVLDNDTIITWLKSNVRVNLKDSKLSAIIGSTLQSSKHSAELLYVEFERLKNAKKYKDCKHVKSGTLDLNNLAAFKFSKNIFKHVTLFSHQKNHEVVILLDWSSSIRNNLMNLIKETITIHMFCVKANIPCSVYIFVKNSQLHPSMFDDRIHKSAPWGSFLIEMLSTATKNHDEQYKLLLIAGDYNSNCFTYNLVKRTFNLLSLGSTPLYVSLFNLPKILKPKVTKNKRICLVIISDGASDSLGLSSPLRKGYYSTFIDPLTKKLHVLNSKDCVHDLVYSRLPLLFPQISILAIHIGSNTISLLNSDGFISDDDSTLRLEAKNQISKKGVYFTKLPLFDHLIIKVTEQQTEEEESTATEKFTKSKFTKSLKNKHHPMCRYIYNQIATSLS